MTIDEGKTHYVGDGCQPAHDPRIDQAHTSTVLCKPCRTYHLDHAPELRAEIEDLTKLAQSYLGEASEEKVRAATAEAEVEQLTLADRQWADHVKRLSEEAERLRAALREYVTGCHACLGVGVVPGIGYDCPECKPARDALTLSSDKAN
jgi:hypothetical protein